MNGACPLHQPVMLAEVLTALAPRDGGLYLDCTFGAGGYTRAILGAASCRVAAVDRDPLAVGLAQALAAQSDGRLSVAEGRFGDLEQLAAAQGLEAADGIVFDLGVSSMHLDTPERGFSFRFDGPLDMRMGRDGPTAADLVQTLPERELARILFEYGEERRARRVAAELVAVRAHTAIERTSQLAELVRRVVPPAHDGIDPATRTFQALRIAVNEEGEELQRGLLAAEKLLRPGGRLVVVAFHSLEDRVIKDFLRRRSGLMPAPSRHQPVALTAARRQPTFRLLERRPQMAAAGEISTNPRARSARLRAAERTAAPISSHPWSELEAP